MLLLHMCTVPHTLLPVRDSLKPMSQTFVTVLLQVPSQGMWAHDNSRVFDDRAVSIVEEAISKGVLPKFRCAAPQSYGSL